MKSVCALSLLAALTGTFLTQTPGGGGRRQHNDQAPAPRQAAPREPQSAPTQASAAQLEATVYLVKVPAERLAEVDARQLTAQATTAADLQKALSGLGTATALYRFDQGVDLASGRDLATLGSNAPFPSSTTTTAGGNPATQVQYQSVGAKISVVGGWEPDGRARVAVDLEISGLANSSIDMGNGAKAPIFRKITQRATGVVEEGHPFLFVNADASAPEADGKALAYVTRVIIHRP